MIKLAINGFGRIGRNAFKIAQTTEGVIVVAINDLANTKTLAHLLKHDSNYGTYEAEVSYDDEHIIVDGQKTRVVAEKEPSLLPWAEYDVDVAIESTGHFTTHDQLQQHLVAGAKRVVLSAPEKGDLAHHESHETFIVGVNDSKITSKHVIVSNASCTTNCIAPVCAVIEEHLGIEKAMMTTVHSYTATQVLQDGPAAKDVREMRSAAENIVPTTTGASKAAALVVPQLKGVFSGMSIRVPSPVVSIADITMVTRRDTSTEELNHILSAAAKSPKLANILDVTDEELVSKDYVGNPHSAIVDLKLTDVVGGNLVKVVAWYDNEWGYANRLVEQCINVGKTI